MVYFKVPAQKFPYKGENMSNQLGFRLIRLAVFVVAMTFAQGLFAQSVVVGSNDSGNCYPFMCNDSGTNVGTSIEYQEVYDPSAFSGAMTINSLTFYYWPFAGPANILNGNYDISLSYSNNGVGFLDPILANNVEGGTSQTFYNGALGGAYGSSFTINGAGFNYNPLDGPLLLDVLVTNQDLVPNGSGNGYNWADYTGSVVARDYAIAGGPNGTGNETGALVTGFNVTSVPEPGTLVMLGTGLLGLAGFAKRKFLS